MFFCSLNRTFAAELINYNDYGNEKNNRTGHSMAEGCTETTAGLATGSKETLGRETTVSNSSKCMKKFDLNRINAKAPYKVSIDGKQFVFETRYGLHYEIRFFEEQPIGGCETWQFSFAKAEDTAAPEDPYVRFTLFAVIDEFFTENEDVMLYICDTSDYREAARNRLFIRWFKQSAEPDRFTIRSASATIEGQGFFAAIMVENRNPRWTDITADFDQTAVSLTNKPSE